jgi:predicted ATPase/class 3 adenylate cyclase
MSKVDEQAKQLRAAIAGLEAQRSVLGEAVVEPALAALRRQLSELAPSSSDVASDEERKIVTVLFVDVSGFTALSESLDPEAVRGLINACFEYLVPVVQKYEGTIDKFIGDEIMALFGAPTAHENDPERALRTALDLMGAIASFNRARATNLNLHIGVNTGPVIAGKIGSQDRREYSVMGDTVNLAARLEDVSPDGQIYVGSNTYRRTAGIFDFEKLTPLELKGKTKPVEVYRLIGLKSAPMPVRGIGGLSAPLIGRDRELEEIRSGLRAAAEGEGGVRAVTGEAGLGKSRLIAEALHSLPNDARWAEGRALSHTAGMSYWMARDLLYDLLRVKPESRPEMIETALRTSITEVSPGNIDRVYPYLGRLLEVPLPAEVEQRVKLLTSEALQSRILQAFQDYTRAQAAREPLILFWEDVHWCDPSSMRVLEMLLPLTKEVPLLLLLAYRPDDVVVEELQQRVRAACAENSSIIKLSPLTRDQSGSLIQNLLRIENLPKKMRELILDRAEGNPFFLEELLRALLDAGAVAIEQNGVVAIGSIESMDVPETLQGVLMARIDRLTPENKHVLQNAAVIGRVFQHRVLAHLSEKQSNGHLDDSLIELQRREFIQSPIQKPSEEREYVFKHAITHDVAYNSLLVSRRKELHRRAAEAIESLFPERLEELSAALGYHFERAETREKAIYYLRQAAERAQATFANTEALAFYQSGLQQVDFLLAATPNETLEQTAAQTHESIGDIQSLIGRHEQARASFENALRRVPQHNVVWSSRLHRKTAKAWIIERQHKNADDSYNEAEMILQRSASSAAEWHQESLQIQLDRMWLHYWQGKVDEIAELAKRIRPDVEQYATPLQRGNFFQGLTLMALRRDRYTAGEETIANAKISLAAIEQSNVLPEIGHARFVLGFSYLWAGQFDPAHKWLNDALRLTEQTGDVVLQSRCLTYLTVIHRRRGEVEQARACADKSLSSAAGARMIEYVGMAKGNLAWVHLREGDLAAAYADGSEGVEKISQTPQGHILVWVALWPLIGVAIARDQIADAIKHAERLLVPPQMAMTAALEAELRSAVEAWKGNDQRAAKLRLQKGADMARDIGYL